MATARKPNKKTATVKTGARDKGTKPKPVAAPRPPAKTPIQTIIPPEPRGCPVVGIGASAGGSEALESFFRPGTERKQAQDILQASEGFTRAILDSLDAHICVLNKQGVILRTNDAWQEFFKYHRDNKFTVGEVGQDYLDECRRVITGGESAEQTILDGIEAVLAGNRPSFSAEYAWHSPEEERWFLLRVTPLREASGVVISQVNITDRQRAEDEVRRSEAFINSVVENLPNMVFVKDAHDLRFVRFNKAGEDLLGYTRDTLIGKNDYDFFPKDEADFFTAKDREVLASGRLLDIPEEPIKTREGAVRSLHTKKIPIVGHGGIPQYLLGISEDITDRKRAEEELRRSQEELQQNRAQLQDLTSKLLTAQEEERQRIARDLHDDFSQRLAALVLDVASLEKQPPLMPQLVVTALEPIRGELERLSDDIHNLAYKLHPSLLKHAGLQAAVEDHIYQVSKRTGVQIVLKAREVPSSLSLDQSTCLFRVLQESLNNVIKHADATEVTVKLSGSSKGVGLSVTDNGTGFDGIDKTANQQKGLGLISMQERMRLQHGFLRIHSRPADGTKVCAWIPFKDRV